MPDRQYNKAFFYPLNQSEYVEIQANGTRPNHTRFACGHCGEMTNGRVLCDYKRIDDSVISWCMCSCEMEAPTVLISVNGQIASQSPIAKEFASKPNWPPDLAKLYDEASKAYSAGAFTTSSMAARKLLMACACHEGAKDGDNFAAYVEYITDKVLTFPRAKAAIDKIRTIGNEANHQLQFVTQDDARRAIQIVTYMLDAIYSLPSA